MDEPEEENFGQTEQEISVVEALRLTSSPSKKSGGKHKYESADFYSTYDLGDRLSSIQSSVKLHPRLQKVVSYFKKVFFSMTLLNILFFILLGIANAIVSFFLDYLISRVLIGRQYFSSLTPYYWINYSMWILYCMVFAFFAVLIPQVVSKYSIGSGIPEMKSILSGIRMERYLGVRTLVAKFLGLIASFGAGMQIGKEGPFVHISSCVAHLLLLLPCFKRIRENEYFRNQIYSVASAAGIAATFGTPFGGVLFSIEVCATYFPVECLWKGIFCSLVGSSIFYLIRSLGYYNNVEVNLFETNFNDRIDIDEYIPMAIMAVLCGILGIVFIQMVKFFINLRQKHDFLQKNSFILVLSCAFIIAAFTFPLDPFLKESNYNVVNILFTERTMKDEIKGENFDHNKNILVALAFASFAKFILTGVSISLPISCGLFTSVFIFGASLGRLFGGYAVVCAACFASSVTRTLSTAVVLFELTGQLEYLMPTMMAICISTFIGNLFTFSIYDTILKLKGLPIFSILVSKEKEKFNLKAEDIMKKNIDFIKSTCTKTELEGLIKNTDHLQFPLVDENMILLGEIQRETVFLSLKKENAKVKGYSVSNINEEIIMKFSSSITEENAIVYDPSVLSISKETPIKKVNFLFSHLGISKIFVVTK